MLSFAFTFNKPSLYTITLYVFESDFAMNSYGYQYLALKHLLWWYSSASVLVDVKPYYFKEFCPW